MSSQNLLKILAFLSLSATLLAVVIWQQTGAAPDVWLRRFAIGTFAIALIVGLFGQETRPRLMLRFLAGLFALVGVIALAADAARIAGPGSAAATSLTQHLSTLTPSLLTSIKGSVARTLGPEVWNTYLGLVFNAPAFLVFGLLALMCGIAGRPRRVVEIFVN